MIHYDKWKFYAEYADGSEIYFEGRSEEDCIGQIADAEKEHGKCLFYTGVNDDEYIDGEYVGRDDVPAWEDHR